MQILFLTAIATTIKLNEVNYKIIITHAVINELIHSSMIIIFQSFCGKNIFKFKKKLTSKMCINKIIIFFQNFLK